MLDFGERTFLRFKPLSIFITHLHPDHVADLPAFKGCEDESPANPVADVADAGVEEQRDPDEGARVRGPAHSSDVSLAGHEVPLPAAHGDSGIAG